MRWLAPSLVIQALFASWKMILAPATAAYHATISDSWEILMATW